MEVYSTWIQNHLLEIFSLGLASVLIFHYIIERDTGLRLSKRYRSSIFETQSRLFLNATQYLISGNKDMAIKEFLTAIDVNRETIEPYFALGGLYRMSGEIEKAVSIHRSLIARNNISESTRLRALKELAKDFDKGGFIDKALETYKDVLKINRDQYEVIQSLCRIYEDIQDWDQAYNYRVMMSKVGHENQGETISHVLVQKAKVFYQKGEFTKCSEDLEDAFRFAPSVSAKILRIRLFLTRRDLKQAQEMLLELLKESPEYTVFVFESLAEVDRSGEEYRTHFEMLKDFFLRIEDKEVLSSPSVVLAKVRILQETDQLDKIYMLIKDFKSIHSSPSQAVTSEYIKILIRLEKKDEAVEEMKKILDNIDQSLAKHYCKNCGHNSDEIFWRCPRCYDWETIRFRWKV